MSIPTPPPVEGRDFLSSTRLFARLGGAGLDDVLEQAEWLIIPGGEQLFRQGDDGDSLYIVYSGRLVALRELEDGSESLVREVGRGESVGELAILTGEPRSATVRALRDTEVMRLSRARMEEIFRRQPAVLLELARMVAGWLNRSDRPAADRSASVAIIAAGARREVLEFGPILAEALGTLGPMIYLDAARVDATFGSGAADSPDGSEMHRRIAGWLNEQEIRHRVVVYETAARQPQWTRRCLRQADRIVIVADADASPTLGAIEPELALAAAGRAPVREVLVLLHSEPSRRPRGTAAWLALRPFRQHYHVRSWIRADYTRVARLLVGEGVGLVLGGGGARGLAHIGVLRALEEAGIPVDIIGGASMGALIAAQYARGHTWQELVEVNRRGWIEKDPMRHVYTLPLISVLSGRKAEKMLEMMFDDDRIEDLWIEYFCVSTNLTRAESVVHREGLLRRWVAASISIPGVTAPKVGDRGELHADGGVLDNLPTGALRLRSRGPIIAVDVSVAVEVRAHESYEEPPSPWSLIRNRFYPPAKQRPFPNILRLIHRAALLGSDIYAKQSKGKIELYLNLPMADYDMFDMRALDQLAQVGYEYTRRVLQETGWPPTALE